MQWPSGWPCEPARNEDARRREAGVDRRRRPEHQRRDPCRDAAGGGGQVRSRGISRWDASGIFGDIEAAGPDVDRPSARTLLLLYAADLAFRLRWEIEPALAEGRRVIVAPYVDTAVALGRASGLDEAWLRTIFQFAPPATERRYVEGTPASAKAGQGFVEFACRRMAGIETRAARQISSPARRRA